MSAPGRTPEPPRAARAPPPLTLRFGDCELDFARGELRRAGVPVELQATPLRLLLYLAERRDRTVRKEELLSAIWQDAIVGDASLAKALANVREAVGDDGDAQRVIRTRKGLGYRFVADTLAVGGDASPPAHEAAQARQRFGLRARLAIGAAIVAALGAGAVVLSRPAPSPLPSAPPFGIAVLPIQNLTASAADRGLADGLTEEITQALAQNGYPVVARTTASLWRERAADVRELGATLGVSHVLEGSVRRQGERVRVSMQLIATDTGKHVWAESFEQAGEDSFALQDRVTSLVAAKISRTVWADEGALKRSPEFARVAQLVIDGRRLFFESRFDEALAANARVLEATPEHEPYLRLRSDVHALLELAWESLYTFGSGRPFREAGPAMLSHAEAAVALAPDSVWAHAALSRALASHWRWAESEREMKRACALDPLRGEHCGSTRAFLCGALGCVQDSIEGARMFVRAMPAEGMSWDTLAGALMNSGQLEEAEAAARRAVELGVPWSNLQDILWRRGKRDEAVENLRRGFAALGSVSAASEIERLRATGPEVAMRWVADQNAHGPLGASWPNINDYLAGLFYAELGDMDAALESIERSVAEHELGMNASAIDPIFDPIRDTPRFRALIEKMGLTAYHAKYLKPRGTGD